MSEIKVLYVEDDVSISVFTSEILSKKTGFDIINASNGLKGLDAFRQDQPDMIISDIRMPEMDGITMIRHIREENSDIPIIITTAFNDMDSVLKCVDLGIDAFIIKPISIDKIVKKILDISERILLKRQVDTQNSLIRKLSLAVENSPVAVGIHDAEGVLDYVNPKYSSLAGGSPEELVGQDISKLMFDQYGLSQYEEMWHAVTSGNDWQGQIDRLSPDGVQFIEQMLVTPYFDDQDQLIHIICVREDITNIHNLQKQLVHSHRMEAVGQLAAGVAHEFNNILTAIISYSSVVSMRLEDDTMKEYMNKIIHSAEKAGNMTRSLLAFSRKDIIKPEPYNLDSFLTNVSMMFTKLVGKDICINVENVDQSIYAMLDFSSIEQVVYNIVNNARESIVDSGSITISAQLAQPDNFISGLNENDRSMNYACIMVKDTGKGMTEDVMRKAFDPFFTTKEVGLGPGLGLSIAYGIIKQHNGYIHLESIFEKGTTVRIFLPLP